MAAGTLQPGCASFFLAPGGEGGAHGILLLLHGFSAGPWQWRPLAQRIAKLGWAAWAPRLPGHGLRRADGEADARDLPRARDWRRYQTAAAAFASQAAASGLAVVPVGLSLGGAMALSLARRPGRPLAAVVLIAPLLRAATWRQRLPLTALRWSASLGASALVDRLPFAWPERPPPWSRPGHRRLTVGQLIAALTFARHARRALAPLPIPCQLITSAADDKVDTRLIRRRLAGGQAPINAHHFPADQRVPHAMLTPEENPNAASRARIATLIGDFLAAHGGRR